MLKLVESSEVLCNAALQNFHYEPGDETLGEIWDSLSLISLRLAGKGSPCISLSPPL